MLELSNITKDYRVQNNVTHALKNVSLNFRKSEFVAILGHSGCGKTTLLNIIGGLDRYTSGDIKINGKSTKEYKDKDWDSYRNHSIGFVFQNYNLIPHQTIIGNVELSLALSGVKRADKRKRAIDALTKVGLGDQLYKKPNQLSGGQMQRVAIARALVNNPEIVLADEPTGALDTETGIAIMDTLKEISKEKLVIVVTHNPQLADKYATRIVNLSDGVIISDSNPYETTKEISAPPKQKRTSMAITTAFGLSLKNLLSKKGRSILTSFAGSIGIIGIALILSISNGLQLYINNIQRDTLSDYPITIMRSSADMNGIMSSFVAANGGVEDLTEYPDSTTVTTDNTFMKLADSLGNGVVQNDMSAFKAYMEANIDMSKISAVKYSYDYSMNLYRNGKKFYPMSLPEQLQSFESTISSYLYYYPTWSEIMDNPGVIYEQYDLLDGSWPSSANDIVIVVDKYNRVNDITLCALGLKDYNELVYQMIKSYLMTMYPNYNEETIKLMLATIFGDINYDISSPTFTFDELLGLEYKLLLNSQYYANVEGVWTSLSTDSDFVSSQLESAIDLKVSGIVRLKSTSTSGGISGSIGYSKQLSKLMISTTAAQPIVIEQVNNPEINVFTGEPFDVLTTYETICSYLCIIREDDPNSIYIYPTDFENKTYVTEFIKQYNASVDEEKKIVYTDIMELVISSVTTIVNSVSYVLIAFVSISLVVSSIMIGIITYVSVLERTKEIGILRSVGARKRDISRVFNAETFLIGLVAGLLGILLTIIINTAILSPIIFSITGINGIASLPPLAALILIAISIFLTVVSGLIPASIASNRDPVVALRTE
ncbi:MAG: ABC transporter ATP-binding protein/permease [Clostridia bacterium]|nr:ABC transporter ATP-binding protein/permease [Clostridia bacterium]